MPYSFTIYTGEREIMTSDYDPFLKFEQLRKQAEQLLQKRPDFTPIASSDMLEAIHELQIYYTELEIQNDELKRAQQEILKLQGEYEDLYEFAPCGYLTFNPQGLILKVNLTGTMLLGTNRGKILRRRFSNLIDSRYQNAYFQAIKEADKTGVKQKVELKLANEKGPIFWIRVDIQTDLAPGGDVIQRRMTLMDITERKIAETALKESEEQFREFFEDAPVAYQSLDNQGTIMAVNQTWLTIFGYLRADVIGKNFSEFLHPEWKGIFKEYCHRCQTQKGVHAAEFGMRTKDGSDILVAFQAKIVKDINGDFKQAHCILNDITAQRKAAEDKKQIEEQQWQSRKMESLGTLTGGIAHEFNNVLAIIIGNSEVALDDVPKWSPTIANIKEIMAASLRARDMVRQLLTFSRKNDPHKKPLDTKAVVRDALKLIRSSLPANIKIVETLATDVDPIVGNATQIHQLLINLCVNAVDAMQTEGDTMTIVLTNKVVHHKSSHGLYTLVPGQYVQLAVSDNGCGMDGKTLEKIFDPFFTTKAVDKGTGLGLAVVHGIVDWHSGVIVVESQPGQGTHFKILIPAYKGPVEPAPKTQTVLPTGSERILFVDDEPSILKLFKLRLEDLGYRVYATIDPVNAFQTFEADPDGFNLIITDMAMPNMTGDQLAAKILAIRPEMPVMLCTGYNEKVSRKTAQEMGISAFIIKPIDQICFAKCVRKVLDKVTKKAEEACSE